MANPTPQQHVALAKVFGPISNGSYFERRAGVPEMEIIENDHARPPSIDNWHTDISWKKDAPLGTAIQIIVTPPAGGNTCWSSMSKAYEWLSPGMQRYLEGLSAVHTWEVSGCARRKSEQHAAKVALRLPVASSVALPVTAPNPRKESTHGQEIVAAQENDRRKAALPSLV